MNDLISRKAVMDEISSLTICITGRMAGKGVTNQFVEEYRKSILRTLDEAATAYDVEKVVEQIGELKQFRLNLADAMSEIQKYGPGRRYVCLEDVVKILKGGGVDE